MQKTHREKGDPSLFVNVVNELTDFNGLSALTSLGGLELIVMESLTDLEAFSDITELDGNLWIGGCEPLSDLSPLEGLTHIGGNVEISYNAYLTDADAEALIAVIGEENVDGWIDIQDNGP